MADGATAQEQPQVSERVVSIYIYRLRSCSSSKPASCSLQLLDIQPRYVQLQVGHLLRRSAAPVVSKFRVAGWSCGNSELPPLNSPVFPSSPYRSSSYWYSRLAVLLSVGTAVSVVCSLRTPVTVSRWR